MSAEVITCSDCGRVFIWSYAEQRFYRERGLSAPKRCPECRSRRRYEQASGDGSSARSQALRDTPQQTAPGARPASPQPVRPVSQPPLRQDYPPSWANPFYRFAAITFGLAMLATAIMWLSAPTLDIVLCWLSAITAVAFLTYGYDKMVSGTGQVRVPENVLLALTFAGGSLGAMAAMRYFHHKTAKTEFQGKFWLVLGVQIVLFIVWLVWLKPVLHR